MLLCSASIFAFPTNFCLPESLHAGRARAPHPPTRCPRATARRRHSAVGIPDPGQVCRWLMHGACSRLYLCSIHPPTGIARGPLATVRVCTAHICLCLHEGRTNSGKLVRLGIPGSAAAFGRGEARRRDGGWVWRRKYRLVLVLCPKELDQGGGSGDKWW